MVPEHWTAQWQEADLTEYRSGFLTGRDGTVAPRQSFERSRTCHRN
ncbi:MAG: hypothetical protein AB7I48_26985 [Planctomycetaceae bacterium]